MLFRYGFVGRNGLGKTTLLRMISEKQLLIPSHISVLHVEQEVGVVGGQVRNPRTWLCSR